jgi:hypothetical protein
MLLDHLDVTATEICADVRDERVLGFDIPRVLQTSGGKQRNHRIEVQNIDGRWAVGVWVKGELGWLMVSHSLCCRTNIGSGG